MDDDNESGRHWPLHPDRAEAKRSPAAVMDDDRRCPALSCDLPRVGIGLRCLTWRRGGHAPTWILQLWWLPPLKLNQSLRQQGLQPPCQLNKGEYTVLYNVVTN
uniref:Uncharacterized protein n=1 Tax=Oryza meridionalis TaxID=40149 RepID=A0A0E0F3V8_9ORYZ